jgi:hypothetical protein
MKEKRTALRSVINDRMRERHGNLQTAHQRCSTHNIAQRLRGHEVSDVPRQGRGARLSWLSNDNRDVISLELGLELRGRRKEEEVS